MVTPVLKKVVFFCLISITTSSTSLEDYTTLQKRVSLPEKNRDTSGFLKLRIGYWSSWQKRCGIAVYTEHVVNALKRLGHTVFVYPNNFNFEQLIEQIKTDKIQVLNIQYEPVLWHCDSCIAPDIWVEEESTLKKQVTKNETEFINGIIALQKLGVKVIVTLHSEHAYVNDIARVADGLLYHKEPVYLSDRTKATVIPMSVPVFKPLRHKQYLRQKYGFLENDTIISTSGFLLKVKRHADILEKLVPWLKTNSHNRVQLLTSLNDISLAQGYSEYEKIRAVIENYNLEAQVTHITDFLPQQELSERLWISDLGYLWFDKNTTSSSAAGKEFIAARLPLVINSSSHYHDLTKGVIRTANDIDTFVATLLHAVRSPKNSLLRSEMESLYTTLNYDTLIMHHIAAFQKVLLSSQNNAPLSNTDTIAKLAHTAHDLL